MASSFDVTANVKLNSANLNANAKKIELALGRITGQASEFQKSLDASTARVFAFGATTAVLNSVNQAFRKLVSTTIEVEKRLIEINSIFQANDKTFNKFRNSIFKVAKDTGQAFNTVAEGAGELARQGLSAEETAKRLKASLVLTRISGLGAEKSVKALTAAINGFASASLSAEQIVNKLVAVDTAFAVSAQDLAEAFSRAGSTAEDAGVSFNELLGLVTAVEQKTARGGAVIGNAFKSIFTRISRGDTIDSLRELGVQIDASQNGIQKLSALSEALTRVSDPTVASQIKELAGGVFQINVVSAALKDLSSETSIFQNAATVAANATNEAFQKNAELNQSIAAQINALVAGLTSLAERIGSVTFGPLLENLLGLTTKFTEFLDKALDPEKGNTFIKALFKTIGNFLSGPAVVIFTVAFVKIFGLVAKFAKDGLKAVFSIGSESAKIKNIEAGIVGLLQKDKQLRNLIASSTASQAQKEAAIINAIRQENTLLTQQAALMNSIASSARAAGVASFSASSGRFKGKFAGGFQQEEAMARMLGAGNNVRAHFGQGTIGGRRFIMNNQEMEIPRFAGGKDSAVIPMYSLGTRIAGAFKRVQNNTLSKEDFISNTEYFASREEGLADFNRRTELSGTGKFISKEKRDKDVAKRKKGETDAAGVLTLDARNIGLLAAKRDGEVPPFSSTAMDTLSDKAQIGVGTIVGAGNKDKINEVRMINLRSAALSDSKPNLEREFRPTVTKNFADPLFNFSKSIVKDVFKGTDRSSVTSKLKQNADAKLFSKATEGGIFESALKMMLAGTRASQAFSKPNNERAAFDFEETGGPTPDFIKGFFGKAHISRADAKRTAGADSARTFISKMLRDPATVKAQKLGKAKFNFAGGFIPKYARGSKGGGNMGGGTGALGALFALDMLNNSFNQGAEEVSMFSKAVQAATVVLGGILSLNMLGMGAGAFSKLKGVGNLKMGTAGIPKQMIGARTNILPFNQTFPQNLANRGAGLSKSQMFARQLAFTKAAPSTTAGMTAATTASKVGFGTKIGAVGAAGAAKVAGIFTGLVIAGHDLVRSYQGLNDETLIYGKLLGGTNGKFQGFFDDLMGVGKKFRKEFALDPEKINMMSRAGSRSAIVNMMGDSGSISGRIAEFERLTGNSQGVQTALQDYQNAIVKAIQATENGELTDRQKTKLQADLTRDLKVQLDLGKKRNALEQKILKARADMRSATRDVTALGIGIGAERSGFMANQASLMGRLAIPDGPKAMQTEAAVFASGQRMRASNARLQSISLKEQLRNETDPSKRAELVKEIDAAGKVFKKAVEDSSIDFRNRLTDLSSKITEAEKARADIIKDRRRRNIQNLGSGASNEDLNKAINKAEKDFAKIAKLIEENRVKRQRGQITQEQLESREKQLMSRGRELRDDPLLKEAAGRFGFNIEDFVSGLFKSGLAESSLNIDDIVEKFMFQGLDEGNANFIKDLMTESGNNYAEKLKQSGTEIDNLNQTYASLTEALGNFEKEFNVDEARGISAGIAKMAKNLEGAAQGLIPAATATSAIEKAATETTRLSEKAMQLFSETDNKLESLRSRIKGMQGSIDDINREMGNL